MRNNKGITLIALVITIIVLLILAGVSIAMLTGENGILTQSQNAKTETSDAEIADRINMALNGEFTNLLADGHFSGYTAPTGADPVALGTEPAILSANGLNDTGVTYAVTNIGTTASKTTAESASADVTILTISATGPESGKNITGSIKITKGTDGKYTINSAVYP